MNLEPLRATLVFVLCAGGSAAAGRRLARALAPGANDPDHSLLGATLGLGLLSGAGAVLAALGALSPWTAWAVVASCWLAGRSELVAWAGLLWRRHPIAREHRWAPVFLAFVLALSFWAAFVPPHQYDSLLYHLTLAQAYGRAHGFVVLPHLMYSFIPQVGESLFALALCLGPDLVAQLLVWSASALSAAWIFDAARREASAPVAWLAAALLAAQTSFMLLASSTYVEPLVMLWTTAAALSLLRWRRDDSRLGWLTASALFAGLAIGTKYYAGITVVILGAWVWLVGAKRGRWREASWFTAVACALFAPWLFRDARLTGDPVYPILYGWFAGKGDAVLAQMARTYGEMMRSSTLGGRWRDLFAPAASGLDVLGGLGWELTLLTVPLAVLAVRAAEGERRRFLARVAGFCAAYGALWFLTGTVVRFLAVLLPLLCLLCAAGLARAWELAGRAGRRGLAAAVGGLVAYQLGLFVYVQCLFGTPRLMLGLESREEFLGRRLDYYACARFASRNLPAADKVLLLGEQRGYYLEREHAASNAFAPDPYVALADEAHDPPELARRLRGAGFSDIIFVPREARRLGTFDPLTDAGRRNWAGLAEGPARLLFRGPACALYSLTAAP